MRLRIRQLRWEAEGVLSLVLEHPARASLPRWAPGAHIGLHLPSGRLRTYSLCGSPAERSEYRIAVLEVPGGRGGSREVHRDLRPGQLIDVDEPVNRFELLDAPSYLFVAGGIGITPLLPMVSEAERRGVPYRLLYGGRSLGSMAFLDELAGADVRPQDEHGLLDLAAALDAHPESLAYACGPEPLLAAMTAACEERGRPLHLERFAAAPVEAADGDGFRLVLARSGRTLDVSPDRSVLETLLDAGVDVPCSCEQGICGTCETRVIEGRPDHRDGLLTEAERASGASMLVCVSRSLDAELVLDL